MLQRHTNQGSLAEYFFSNIPIELCRSALFCLTKDEQCNPVLAHSQRNSKVFAIDSIGRWLPVPVFAEATGVLEMIAGNPEGRQLYEDRLKAERDEWERIAQAEFEVRLE